MHEAGQGQGVLELVSLWLWHLRSGEFSFNVIPLIYLHLLPGEGKIVPSSALQDPKDTQFAHVIAPCVCWAASLLPGSWQKTDYLQFEGKMREGWRKGGGSHRPAWYRQGSMQLFGWLACFVWGIDSERKNL